MIGIIDSYKVTLVLRKNFLSSDPPDGGFSERFMSPRGSCQVFDVAGCSGWWGLGGVGAGGISTRTWFDVMVLSR